MSWPKTHPREQKKIEKDVRIDLLYIN